MIARLSRDHEVGDPFGLGVEIHRAFRQFQCEHGNSARTSGLADGNIPLGLKRPKGRIPYSPTSARLCQASLNLLGALRFGRNGAHLADANQCLAMPCSTFESTRA